MGKALILFGSTTGNTEDMAGTVQKALEDAGLQTVLKNVMEATVNDLAADNDLIVLGCPAYGDDSIELQEDFEEFYTQMDTVQLDGKPFAVFAPGDSSYEHFCGSVDKLEEKMIELGGKLVQDGLKIDGDPADYQNEIVEWAQSIAGELA